MSLRNKIQDDGYVILKNVFSRDELMNCKKEINNYIKTNKTVKNAGGITIPNFINMEGFKQTTALKDNEKIKIALKEIFNGSNYRFCSHNDIGINRVVGWHKDKLNGEYAKYETVNIWTDHEGHNHEIVKVLIYLESHNNNNDGLAVVPKSHLNPIIEDQGYIQLTPELGDVIIFDQRITHRGMVHQVPNPRILVSFGFGKNNIFTDNFEKGTIIRQNSINF
jgi:ectoine hydroxylase-related dioxygenase (phytanoyl-CoA dioxygenase family)